MSLLFEAMKTYDAMEKAGLVGVKVTNSAFFKNEKYAEKAVPLAPVAHNTTKMTYLITVDKDGNFVNAESGGEKVYILPVTENSASRTRNARIEPHPLSDNLKYFDPANKESLDCHIELLGNWAASEFGDPRLNAVLSYLKKGTIMDDIRKAGISPKEEDKETEDSPKKEKKTESSVAWKVVGLKEKPETYEDPILFKKWTDYYLSTRKDDEKVLCMITGKQDIPATDSLKGILSIAPNAKLIKGADGSVLTVGYTAIQKSHNTLKWLMANGCPLGGPKGALCWSPDTGMTFDVKTSFLGAEESDPIPENYSRKLRKKVDGLCKDLKITGRVCTAVFEAEVQGRVAVSFYSESGAGQFLKMLENWDNNHSYMNNVAKDRPIMAPGVYEVVLFAIGHLDSKEKLSITKAQEKLASQLQSKIIERKTTGGYCPQEIVQLLVERFGTSGCRGHFFRDRLGWVTCAMIRGMRIGKYREDIGMSLNTERKDRSYQFGRLLAVMEKAERDTFDKNEKREPNAIKMLSAFVQKPGQTTQVIMDKLKPAYWPKLSPGARVMYDRLIGEIMDKLGEFPNDYGKRLSETYIPGYYAQRNALYTKSADAETSNTDGDNAEIGA